MGLSAQNGYWRSMAEVVAQLGTEARGTGVNQTALSEALAATFFTTEYGKSFYVCGFIKIFRNGVREPDCPKDAAYMGCAKQQLGCLQKLAAPRTRLHLSQGIKTLSEVERYTRAVEQKRLAQEAMIKIE